MKKLVTLMLVCVLVLSAIPAQPAQSPAGYTLRIGTSEDLDSLSPFLAYERAATELFLLVYDSLTSFDAELDPAPGLAESWTVSADSLVWTFKLKQGVKWSDGQPFTSKDVKFTFDTMASAELGLYYGFLAGIESVETPDNFTVVIRTSEPKANLLQNPTPILPEHIWKAGLVDLEDFEDPAMVGTGPFRFSEWKKSQYFSLTANAEYHGQKPKVANIVFTIFANRETLSQSLIQSELDVALNLYPDQVAQLEKDEGIEIRSFSANGFTQMTINCWDDPSSGGEPALLDPRVRKAIDLGINKKDLVGIAFSGGGIPGYSIIPPATAFWHYKVAAPDFNPGEAARLLDLAGYDKKDATGMRLNPNGSPLSLTLIARAENPREVKAGQMIQGFMRSLGISMELTTLDDGALSDLIASGDFDMFIWGWGGDVDPTTLLSILTSDQIDGTNEGRWSVPEFDELVAKQYTLLDAKERQAAVFKAQELVWQSAPMSILSYDLDIQAWRGNLLTGLQSVAGGAVFYANTNVNYLSVEPLVMVEKTGSGGNILVVVIVGLVIIAAGIFFFMKKRTRGSAASWKDEK